MNLQSTVVCYLLKMTRCLFEHRDYEGYEPEMVEAWTVSSNSHVM